MEIILGQMRKIPLYNHFFTILIANKTVTSKIRAECFDFCRCEGFLLVN